MNGTICVRLIESQIKGGKEIIVWQPTPIVSALSLESVRIVIYCKVYKRPKTAVALLAKQVPHFSQATFFNRRVSAMCMDQLQVSVLKRCPS